LLWFLCWTFALFHSEHGAAEPTDWMKPPSWSGNFWGPAATRDRATGKLPPIHFTKSMTRWDSWGKSVLRDGDIVFRLGDARTLAGCFPMSQFIADASASRYSHTGVVAVEDGSVVVYDCSSSGIQRQPFAVWMLDCMGPMGIKRLKEQERKHIPGVLKYCRDTFLKQVPFDYGFQIDDRELYCVEMTEKAFRSEGLALSAPVLLGDWQNLVHFPLTTFLFEKLSVLALEQPFSVDQPVYVPGNETEGIWASPLLEQVYPKKTENIAAAKPPAPEPGKLSLRGDVAVAKFVVYELRRSYNELPLRILINYLPRRSSAASIAKDDARSDEEDREPTVAERGVPAPRVR
jgi:Permuted papain-like amidase enzyme, YaeF/YiiX, C92 family